MMSTGKKQLKVLILGDSAVGKTSLMERFVNDQFSALYKPTIGADFLCRDIEVTLSNGTKTKVKLQIWDTAGQEQWFQSLGVTYYRGADACVLVYDATVAKSLQSLDQWRNDFLEHAALQDPSKFPFAVVGNMMDKQDQIVITAQRGENFAQVRGGNIKHFQVSAKTGEGVYNIFEQLATMACEVQDTEQYYGADNFVIHGEGEKLEKKNTGCC
ncbi:Rab1a [Hexamita inflata]|uniref:Rab1a n=1 Tax=Hexamita inflata TaxID=28002 RepID=A0AA86RLJ3_9EUKA|nr:Rab1a [Hexamita inflata]CAI9959609.1 Rab1a [Hexamita inflata]CAI9968660.1 Rab1a [Hexamita inflata]CAI9972617.1 Rab1a [Hexamita inflata]